MVERSERVLQLAFDFDAIPVRAYNTAGADSGAVQLTINIATRLPARRFVATGPMTAALSAMLLAATWPGTAGAQAQMLPPSGGVGSPSTFGTSRSLPQSQSIAPTYPPPNSAMPLLSTPAATMPIPAFGGGASGGAQSSLALSARFSREMPAAITNGLVWRVFPVRPEANGAFRAIREDTTGSPVLTLPAGDYVVHVSFGLATTARAVHVKDTTTREVFELPAGGIKLEGRVGDVKIPPSAISFDIFRGSQFEQSSKAPMAQNVQTGDVVVVPDGNYYIVSNYGDGNAVVRSDIRVQTGKLTEVTVSHRAAIITLKLVGERGGDPIANTNWLVITPGGDVIKESTGVFPRMVLAEGDYRALARNEGRTYERDFKVVTGVDGEIEVLAR
jgi:hypothetical protein